MTQKILDLRDFEKDKRQRQIQKLGRGMFLGGRAFPFFLYSDTL